MSAEIELSVSEIQDLYETDFHAWTQEQVRLLKQRAWEQLDVANLAEEIESLGKQQRQELRNRLRVLLGHLLKWQFQAEARSKSWYATIREQRREILNLLQENPSLKPYLSEAVEKAYLAGIDLAVRETPLRYRDLPAVCPYNLEQVLEGAFFPGQATELSDWE
jgi:ribosomal protein L29